MPSEIHSFLNDHRDRFAEQLSEWLRLCSVAGVPEHVPEVVRSAHWIAGALRELGFPTVDLWPAGDTPAVYAEWCVAPGAPTVLAYSHHDVRAVKDEQWSETAPFEPVLRDGYLYGRGASDAKGQVMAHLWGLRAHLAATGRDAPAVNLKILVEGEEETGSAHLAGLLDEHRPQADLIVFSDTLLWHRDHPAVCLSMRGMVLAELEIHGPLRDIHSGAVSGPAPNPAVELARLIGQLHDDKGRVTLPGFYDAVVEPSERTREQLAALPYSDADWLTRPETRSICGEEGFTVLERLWARPAAEVLPVVAGDPEGPSRGAVPAVATAVISIRTVPDQTVAEVAEQLRRWVRTTISDRFEYRLSIGEETGQEPYRTWTTIRRWRSWPRRWRTVSARRPGGWAMPAAGRPNCSSASSAYPCSSSVRGCPRTAGTATTSGPRSASWSRARPRWPPSGSGCPTPRVTPEVPDYGENGTVDAGTQGVAVQP